MRVSIAPGSHFGTPQVSAKALAFINNKKSIVPDGPYRLKEGKNEGDYVETLIFTNPAAFWELVNKSPNCGNGLGGHLNFLLSVPLSPIMTCPLCCDKKVRYFADHDKLSVLHTACHDCLSGLLARYPNRTIYNIELNTLRNFSEDKQIEIAKYFQLLYGLPGKNEDGIFVFFKTNYKSFIKNLGYYN
jgi:hypothetical protein